jgi:hypothetical protein
MEGADYILKKTIRMQMEVDGSMESIRWRELIICTHT